VHREPCRVLLAENTVRGLGGSYESLFITASSLDRSRFEPVVLFFQPNHFVEKLKSVGIKVLIASSKQFWEKQAYLDKSAKIRSSLPRKGWLGAIRRRIVAFVRSIVGGIPMAWTVYWLLKREKIKILHTNNNLQRDAMMILAGVIARVPVIAHERQMARCSCLARMLSRRVRTLICISEAVLEHTKTSGCLVAARQRIYNAVDVAGLRAVRPSLPAGPLRAGIAGRIMQKKGQRFFIEAAARLRDEFPSAEFYVIGQATGDDRAYEEEIRRLANNLGLVGSMHWTGYLEDPLPLIASLDVVVHAAIEPEPFGRVIIEALALGRPVVATALGGPVEIIQDGLSGLLVPPADSRAIADKISTLFHDRDYRARVSAGALHRAEEFGVERYIRQIEKVYEDVLEEKTAPHGLERPPAGLSVRR
jgi:glycosyltransferase involved in cell wall biosynthesis